MNKKLDDKENPVIYIVLNGELNMSPGKACAQSVHAAMLLEGNYSGLFVSGYKRTVVTLEAENGETIKNLLEYLQGAEIFATYYIDECSETKQPYQVTALAIEPIAHDDTEKRSILENFPLFGKDHKPKSAKSTWQALSDYINENEIGWFGCPWYVRKTVKWLKKEVK